MKLLEVELVGFKSFAHKTTFQFRDGLTAIIGPNGSGKSNFTEAVRWVLGEQSLKQLRGHDSTDVIFAGTAGTTRRGYASVTLTLSNESGRLPLPAAEVVLGRRLNRSGESEYTLNGDPVRLHEVHQLLADAGIGTKSYTVISQGTVDRYLTAPPAGRRELFDEATGVKSLQLKLSRAERTLQAAQRKAQELQLILHELEPRLRVLKRQLRQQAERDRLAAEHDAGQAAFFHQTRHQYQQRLDQATAAVATADAARAEARVARATAEQQLLTTVEQQSTGPTSASHRQLLAELHQAEMMYQAAQETYQAQRRQRQELTTSLARARQARVDADRALQQARREGATTDVFKPYRHTLQRCHQLLQELTEGSSPDPATLAALQREVADHLTHHLEENEVLAAAQVLVERIAGPLQASARAEALEQDRQRQLDALPALVTPSEQAVAALREAVQRYTSAHPESAPAQRQIAAAALQHAREAELASERALSTATTTHTQAAADLASLDQEIRRERGSAFLQVCMTTAPTASTPALSRTELEHLAGRLSQLGTIDPLAQKEYEEVHQRTERLAEQLRDSTETHTAATTLIRSLRAQIQHQFRQQFAVIQTAFNQYFQQLFGGGTAQLEIVTVAAPQQSEADEKAVLLPGVDILVHPPGKQLQHVHLLSGGEKALTSLALLFAILKVQQPPFLILDEVDAALDEANSHRFSELLRTKSASTQCIVVSHNRETMSHADMLYGITMQQDGVSKAYSVKLTDFAAVPPVEMAV